MTATKTNNAAFDVTLAALSGVVFADIIGSEATDRLLTVLGWGVLALIGGSLLKQHGPAISKFLKERNGTAA